MLRVCFGKQEQCNNQFIVCVQIKPVFHFNSIVAKRSVSFVSISFVLSECSQNNEIRYLSLRYGRGGKQA